MTKEARVDLYPQEDFDLAINSLMDELSARLPGVLPDWDSIADSVRSSQIFQNGKLDWNRLRSLVSEYWLKEALSSLGSRYGDRIEFDPIPDGSVTSEYRFSTHDDQLYAYNKLGYRYAELDAITEIDGIPVVWEIKMGQYTSRHQKDFYKAYDMRHIAKVTAPVRQWYQELLGTPSSQCGYVVIVPPEKFNPSAPTYRKALASGILTYTFYTDLPGFRTDILRELGNRQILPHVAGVGDIFRQER